MAAPICELRYRDAYSCDDSDYEPNEESTDSDDDDLEQDPNE